MNDKYMDLVEDKYKESYLLYKNNDTTDKRWSSHQPILIHVLNTITEGAVLEFGIGYHSTPIMHTICKEQNRNLLSIETNPIWFRKFAQYKDKYHSLEIVTLEKLVNDHHIFNKKFAIAFIDGSTVELRQKVLEKINADYILVHDTEVAGVYDFSMFKYVDHFKFFKTTTSVLSNLEKIDEKILNIFNS